jgi:hypothetical protein
MQLRSPSRRIEKPVVKAVKGMVTIKFAGEISVLKKWRKKSQNKDMRPKASASM